VSYFQLIAQGDAVSRLVALLLLGMSVASWVVILWKVWLLPRARTDVARSVAAFWQSASLADARQRLSPFDREALVLPLIAATRAEASGTLAAAGDRAQQLTRVLRDALHVAVNKLQYGQVLLATVGSTAPVRGIAGHGLGHLSRAHQYRERRADHDRQGGRPGRRSADHDRRRPGRGDSGGAGLQRLRTQIGRIEAELEGFARDLRELLANHDGVAR
jgi:biopolymer transport protein ExbB